MKHLLPYVSSQNMQSVLFSKMYYICYCASTISQLMIAIISVDRAVTLTLPFLARKLSSVKVVLSGVTLTYIISIFVFMPFLLFYDLVWTYDPIFDDEFLVPQLSDFAKAHQELVVNASLVVLVIKPIGTFFVVTSSVVTLIYIKRASAVRAKLTSADGGSQNLDHKISRMLQVVAVISVACVLPEQVKYEK